jgi:hypothetical protein
VGNHPLWQLFRTARQMTMPPLFLGGLALGTGYFWALLRCFERPVSRDLIVFHRREQMQRLNNFFTGNISSTKILQPSVEPQVSRGQQDRADVGNL